MLRTAILLAGLTALFLGAGFLLGGQAGLVIALAVAVVMNGLAYWNSDRMVLRLYGAREVKAGEARGLYTIVKQLASRANMPMPRVYIIENEQPNAFATGRDPRHGAVAATTGLLRELDSEEIAGVMAHELAHIRNRDTLIMTITATLAGALSMLASFALFFGGNRNHSIVGTLLLMVFAPLAATLVQMAISRTREYAADKEGAEICGHPLWLAEALRKLGRNSQTNPTAESHPATAHLFIVNPLRKGGRDHLFSTHPKMDNRIRRLREMAAVGKTSGPWG